VNRAVAGSFVSCQRTNYFSGFPDKKPKATLLPQLLEGKISSDWKMETSCFQNTFHFFLHNKTNLASLYPVARRLGTQQTVLVSFWKLECWEVPSVQWSRKV